MRGSDIFTGPRPVSDDWTGPILRLRPFARPPRAGLCRGPRGAQLPHVHPRRRATLKAIRIGTRKSTMALAQTEEIMRQLSAAWPGLEVAMDTFDTRGDRDQASKLLRHGGKGGAFVAEIRAAMLDGRLEAAMHSLKDMPGNEETPRLVIGATLKRDSAQDALVLRPGVALDDLSRDGGAGFKIGTNAVRRAA